jgi:hypothetical protein
VPRRWCLVPAAALPGPRHRPAEGQGDGKRACGGERACLGLTAAASVPAFCPQLQEAIQPLLEAVHAAPAEPTPMEA